VHGGAGEGGLLVVVLRLTRNDWGRMADCTFFYNLWATAASSAAASRPQWKTMTTIYVSRTSRWSTRLNTSLSVRPTLTVANLFRESTRFVSPPCSNCSVRVLRAEIVRSVHAVLLIQAAAWSVERRDGVSGMP
jgi:hypothetical protein